MTAYDQLPNLLTTRPLRTSCTSIEILSLFLYQSNNYQHYALGIFEASSTKKINLSLQVGYVKLDCYLPPVVLNVFRDSEVSLLRSLSWILNK